MTDETTLDDGHEQSTAPIDAGTGGGASRRGVLESLGALGGLAVPGWPIGGAAAAVTRSRESWRVEIDGETGLELDPAARIDIDGEAYTAGGNHRVGHLNEVADDAAGATIGGGGFRSDDSDSVLANRVHSHFGTIGGGAGNLVGVEDAPDAGTMATVGGGIRNEAAGVSGTVGGGIGNHADGRFATVAGGGGNAATAEYAAVGGGRSNPATDDATTVAGGHQNAARGRRATVGGGHYNRALAAGATVPGGAENVADGEYSLATGYHADTNGHDGAFVVGDSSDEPVRAEGDDTAVFQMPIRAPAFNTTSTRAAKTDFEPVDADEVLQRVRALEVERWRFDGETATHMGPTAEDFHAAFDLGADAESIATVDADGVALAAIQALGDRVDELEAELADRDERIDELEDRLAALEQAQAQASP